MDPATGLMVASGIGAAANIFGGSSANKQAMAQTQQQEAFQQQMSSTAYQRAVTDMKAAGLNPALMYGSGGPESSPSGSAAPIKNILGDAADEVTSSAASALQLEQQTKKTQSDIDLNTELAKTQTNIRNLQDAQASAARATARGVGADAISKEQDAQILQDHPWIAKLDAIASRLKGMF